MSALFFAAIISWQFPSNKRKLSQSIQPPKQTENTPKQELENVTVILQ